MSMMTANPNQPPEPGAPALANFELVFDLIHVIADPKRAKQRLTELQEREQAICDGQEFRAWRDQQNTALAQRTADLDQREAALNKRESELAVTEKKQAERSERLEAQLKRDHQFQVERMAEVEHIEKLKRELAEEREQFRQQVRALGGNLNSLKE